MTGTILGFDATTGIGTISADNGVRYKFIKEEWKDKSQIKQHMKVDFEADQDNSAKEVYLMKDEYAHNTSLLGLLVVFITFFLGFIGTFISRVFIAKQPISKVVLPTVLHFLATISVVIPLIGWIIFIIATLYFMVKNYQFATASNLTL